MSANLSITCAVIKTTCLPKTCHPIWVWKQVFLPSAGLTLGEELRACWMLFFLSLFFPTFFHGLWVSNKWSIWFFHARTASTTPAWTIVYRLMELELVCSVYGGVCGCVWCTHGNFVRCCLFLIIINTPLVYSLGGLLHWYGEEQAWPSYIGLTSFYLPTTIFSAHSALSHSVMSDAGASGRRNPDPDFTDGPLVSSSPASGNHQGGRGGEPCITPTLRRVVSAASATSSRRGWRGERQYAGRRSNVAIRLCNANGSRVTATTRWSKARHSGKRGSE